VRAACADCADAIAAVAAGRVDVTLRADELDLLPEALDAAEKGFVVVSTRVLEGARRLPPLTEGDRAMLRLVADGAANDAIAEALSCSTASVKRGLRRLSALLGVGGRPALIRAARALGFERGSPN